MYAIQGFSTITCVCLFFLFESSSTSEGQTLASWEAEHAEGVLLDLHLTRLPPRGLRLSPGGGRSFPEGNLGPQWAIKDPHLRPQATEARLDKANEQDALSRGDLTAGVEHRPGVQDAVPLIDLDDLVGVR